MWNQFSSASSANNNRNGHENGHRIVTFRARFVFLWHFGHRIAAFRARFGFGPFRWYIFGQVCKIMLDLVGFIDGPDHGCASKAQPLQIFYFIKSDPAEGDHFPVDNPLFRSSDQFVVRESGEITLFGNTVEDGAQKQVVIITFIHPDLFKRVARTGPEARIP